METNFNSDLWYVTCGCSSSESSEITDIQHIPSFANGIQYKPLHYQTQGTISMYRQELQPCVGHSHCINVQKNDEVIMEKSDSKKTSKTSKTASKKRWCRKKRNKSKERTGIEARRIDQKHDNHFSKPDEKSTNINTGNEEALTSHYNNREKDPSSTVQQQLNSENNIERENCLGDCGTSSPLTMTIEQYIKQALDNKTLDDSPCKSQKPLHNKTEDKMKQISLEIKKAFPNSSLTVKEYLNQTLMKEILNKSENNISLGEICRKKSGKKKEEMHCTCTMPKIIEKGTTEEETYDEQTLHLNKFKKRHLWQFLDPYGSGLPIGVVKYNSKSGFKNNAYEAWVRVRPNNFNNERVSKIKTGENLENTLLHKENDLKEDKEERSSNTDNSKQMEKRSTLIGKPSDTALGAAMENFFREPDHDIRPRYIKDKDKSAVPEMTPDVFDDRLETYKKILPNTDESSPHKVKKDFHEQIRDQKHKNEQKIDGKAQSQQRIDNEIPEEEEQSNDFTTENEVLVNIYNSKVDIPNKMAPSDKKLNLSIDSSQQVDLPNKKLSSDRKQTLSSVMSPDIPRLSQIAPHIPRTEDILQFEESLKNCYVQTEDSYLSTHAPNLEYGISEEATKILSEIIMDPSSPVRLPSDSFPSERRKIEKPSKVSTSTSPIEIEVLASPQISTTPTTATTSVQTEDAPCFSTCSHKQRVVYPDHEQGIDQLLSIRQHIDKLIQQNEMPCTSCLQTEQQFTKKGKCKYQREAHYKLVPVSSQEDAECNYFRRKSIILEPSFQCRYQNKTSHEVGHCINYSTKRSDSEVWESDKFRKGSNSSNSSPKYEVSEDPISGSLELELIPENCQMNDPVRERSNSERTKKLFCSTIKNCSAFQEQTDGNSQIQPSCTGKCNSLKKYHNIHDQNNISKLRSKDNTKTEKQIKRDRNLDRIQKFPINKNNDESTVTSQAKKPNQQIKLKDNDVNKHNNNNNLIFSPGKSKFSEKRASISADKKFDKSTVSTSIGKPIEHKKPIHNNNTLDSGSHSTEKLNLSSGLMDDTLISGNIEVCDSSSLLDTKKQHKTCSTNVNVLEQPDFKQCGKKFSCNSNVESTENKLVPLSDRTNYKFTESKQFPLNQCPPPHVFSPHFNALVGKINRSPTSSPSSNRWQSTCRQKSPRVNIDASKIKNKYELSPRQKCSCRPAHTNDTPAAKPGLSILPGSLLTSKNNQCEPCNHILANSNYTHTICASCKSPLVRTGTQRQSTSEQKDSCTQCQMSKKEKPYLETQAAESSRPTGNIIPVETQLQFKQRKPQTDTQQTIFTCITSQPWDQTALPSSYPRSHVQNRVVNPTLEDNLLGQASTSSSYNDFTIDRTKLVMNMLNFQFKNKKSKFEPENVQYHITPCLNKEQSSKVNLSNDDNVNKTHKTSDKLSREITSSNFNNFNSYVSRLDVQPSKELQLMGSNNTNSNEPQAPQITYLPANYHSRELIRKSISKHKAWNHQNFNPFYINAKKHNTNNEYTSLQNEKVTETLQDNIKAVDDNFSVANEVTKPIDFKSIKNELLISVTNSECSSLPLTFFNISTPSNQCYSTGERTVDQIERHDAKCTDTRKQFKNSFNLHYTSSVSTSTVPTITELRVEAMKINTSSKSLLKKENTISEIHNADRNEQPNKLNMTEENCLSETHLPNCESPIMKEAEIKINEEIGSNSAENHSDSIQHNTNVHNISRGFNNISLPSISTSKPNQLQQIPRIDILTNNLPSNNHMRTTSNTDVISLLTNSLHTSEEVLQLSNMILNYDHYETQTFLANLPMNLPLKLPRSTNMLVTDIKEHKISSGNEITSVSNTNQITSLGQNTSSVEIFKSNSPRENFTFACIEPLTSTEICTQYPNSTVLETKSNNVPSSQHTIDNKNQFYHDEHMNKCTYFITVPFTKSVCASTIGVRNIYEIQSSQYCVTNYEEDNSIGIQTSIDFTSILRNLTTERNTNSSPLHTSRFSRSEANETIFKASQNSSILEVNDLAKTYSRKGLFKEQRVLPCSQFAIIPQIVQTTNENQFLYLPPNSCPVIPPAGQQTMQMTTYDYPISTKNPSDMVRVPGIASLPYTRNNHDMLIPENSNTPSDVGQSYTPPLTPWNSMKHVTFFTDSSIESSTDSLEENKIINHIAYYSPDLESPGPSTLSSLYSSVRKVFQSHFVKRKKKKKKKKKKVALAFKRNNKIRNVKSKVKDKEKITGCSLYCVPKGLKKHNNSKISK